VLGCVIIVSMKIVGRVISFRGKIRRLGIGVCYKKIRRLGIGVCYKKTS
jgi:hypothetical protein